MSFQERQNFHVSFLVHGTIKHLICTVLLRLQTHGGLPLMAKHSSRGIRGISVNISTNVIKLQNDSLLLGMLMVKLMYNVISY